MNCKLQHVPLYDYCDSSVVSHSNKTIFLPSHSKALKLKWRLSKQIPSSSCLLGITYLYLYLLSSFVTLSFCFFQFNSFLEISVIIVNFKQVTNYKQNYFKAMQGATTVWVEPRHFHTESSWWQALSTVHTRG